MSTALTPQDILVLNSRNFATSEGVWQLLNDSMKRIEALEAIFTDMQGSAISISKRIDAAADAALAAQEKA